ncbi:MAG: hypothetical protein OEY67_08315 [Gammaproteobacteria bacterium]|nr:hypothetical protein [Gammaproteobacteria bacterium]
MTTKKENILLPEDGGRRRLLVAIDATLEGELYLDVAASISKLLNAELSGLYVESQELLQLAQLPMVHEVGFYTASRRTINRERMIRTMKSQAGRAVTLLKEVASRYSLHHSFHVTQGELLPELLSASSGELEPVAIIMKGRLRRAAERVDISVATTTRKSKCAVLLIYEVAKTQSAVAILYDGSPEADESLRLANTLARERHRPLSVILAESQYQGQDLRDKASNLVGADVIEHYYQLDKHGVNELILFLRHINCGVLLFPVSYFREGGPVSAEQLYRLVYPGSLQHH